MGMRGPGYHGLRPQILYLAEMHSGAAIYEHAVCIAAQFNPKTWRTRELFQDLT